MKAFSLMLVLAATAGAAAPATALAALQAAPMTEPTPDAVVQAAGRPRSDHTARPPAMGQSTRAIMMPGVDMPAPVRMRASGPAPTHAGATPPR